MSETQKQTEAKAPYTIIKRLDGSYWCSLNVSNLTNTSTWLSSFLIWLEQKEETDTIVFDFHTGSGFSFGHFEQYLTGLNAIHLSKAKTTAQLNHCAEGNSPYFYLVCDTLEISPYGQLNFSPLFSAEEKTSPCLQAMRAFGSILLENAADQKLLTYEELDSLKNGARVYLDATALTERLSGR